MFSGIIECIGTVLRVSRELGNVEFEIVCPFASSLVIGQSIAHNGVCLTVTSINTAKNSYTVTAITETLLRTNLGLIKEQDELNLEKSVTPSTFLDGHIVQGHIDTTAECILCREDSGSWIFTFKHVLPKDKFGNGFTVNKGSVAVNGVSLTVVNAEEDRFSVAIIPHTLKHTTFRSIRPGHFVNIEFDIIGKYIARLMAKSSY